MGDSVHNLQGDINAILDNAGADAYATIYEKVVAFQGEKTAFGDRGAIFCDLYDRVYLY